MVRYRIKLTPYLVYGKLPVTWVRRPFQRLFQSIDGCISIYPEMQKNKIFFQKYRDQNELSVLIVVVGCVYFYSGVWLPTATSSGNQFDPFTH